MTLEDKARKVLYIAESELDTLAGIAWYPSSNPLASMPWIDLKWHAKYVLSPHRYPPEKVKEAIKVITNYKL